MKKRALALVFVAVLAVVPARAPAADFSRIETYIYEVLLDKDNNPATGGPVRVVQGMEMPHNELGIDYIVRVHVGFQPNEVIGAPPLILPDVLARDVLKWNPSTMMFDLVDCDATIYPMGVDGMGHGLVEFGTPLAFLDGELNGARAVFHASHAPFVANDYTQSFIIDGRAAAPALSPAMLAGLIICMGAVALWSLRRRGVTGVTRAAAVVLVVAGVAWAATIVLDGDFDDWIGIPAAVTDVSGDSSIGDPAEDILAGYATQQGGNAFFKMDLMGLPMLI